MAWEWVAPVAVGVTGAIGVFFTWFAGYQGREHSETLAQRAQAHDLTMAEQARRADAYVELLDLAEHVGYWAQTLRPVLDVGQQRGEPPPVDRQIRANALVQAFGSPVVQERVEAWREVVNEINRVDRKIGLAIEMRDRHGASGIDYLDAWNELEERLRPAERTLRDELAKAINAELSAKHPSRGP